MSKRKTKYNKLWESQYDGYSANCKLCQKDCSVSGSGSGIGQVRSGKRSGKPATQTASCM